MSKPPRSVEILGPWLQNNGDGLNLWAVADRMAGSATLAVSSPLGLDELPERPALSWVKWKPDWEMFSTAVRSGSPASVVKLVRDGAVLALAPRSMFESRGLVPGRELTALLDCSGYAYGDVWSTHRVEERIDYYRRLKQQGSLVIMLPQAFGPFEEPAMRKCATELLGLCDLVYARDDISLGHLRKLGLGPRIVGTAPDITHLLEGTVPEDPAAWRGCVCVVPNARMLDRTSPEVSERYTQFLLQTLRLVRERDLEPFLVVHEKNDLPLAEKIRDTIDFPVSIINEDALISKGILGACHAVVGSRYHALISALSQGVPTIGTSWSHKYSELFGDYGCARYLVSPADGTAEIEAKVAALLDPARRKEIARNLSEKAQVQKGKVDAMWTQIESLIAAHPGNA